MSTRTAILLLEPDGACARDRALAALAGRFEVAAVLGGDRDGLAAALELVARAGEATLAVSALSAAAGSLEELLELLDWLAAAGAHLYAIDVQLDSATPAGRRAVEVLRALARWQHEPARRAARGRPGLAAHAPELASRIAALRERGMSLQAIADELNRGRVPTPRGGALWRPSSVQAALGYRRPRPPGPLPLPLPPPPAAGEPAPAPRPGPPPGPPRPRPPHGPPRRRGPGGERP